MALAGIELTFLVKEITDETAGYYVNNIYAINRDSILFKLHHPEKPDIFLVLSTSGMWLSAIKIDQIEENKMIKRLRDDLLRLRITKIEQIGVERIAYLTFSGFDKEFVLICEFFGDGNILLCDPKLKILALLHSIEVRHRELHVGMTYTPPPQMGLNIFDITEKNFDESRSVTTPIVKWLGRAFGLPAKYAELIIKMSEMDPSTPAEQLTSDDIKKIVSVASTLTQKIVSGDHDTIIVKTEKGYDVYPVRAGDETDYEEAASFMEGLDKTLSKMLLERGKTVQSSELDKQISELQGKIDEQEKAMMQVKEKAETIAKVARSLFELSSSGIISIVNEFAVEKMRSQNAEIIKEKGIDYIKIGTEKIQIKTDSSIPAIASLLYDESKKQATAIEFIRNLREKNIKALEKLKTQSTFAREKVSFTQMRKKNWFERYRWFYTTSGHLAIGGRDSSSNSAIIRKHLGRDDKVFHAEIFGSPFFVLKDVPGDIPFDTINEVAHATVCFSRAWREAMYGMSAYWINPDQVKKSAPSGQFLTRGAFVLEGQKNFVKVPELKLAVGILEKDGYYMITCGPPDPIKKICICFAIIQPGNNEMPEVAKKLRTEFIRLQEGIAKQFTIDDFVRVLPAGTTNITEITQGKVEPS
jgi:predicted ribosome quality control (RQC) complex YloA/Tae2 family protein